jgi:acetyl-CoA acyltransferase 1
LLSSPGDRILNLEALQRKDAAAQESFDQKVPYTMNDNDVVIVSATRTPLCRARKGGLAKIPPSTLLQVVLEHTLQRSGVAGADIGDLCVGNCLMGPSGYAALRMAHIVAGIPETTSFQTVNRQCSSGLQACAMIANRITAGEIDVGIGAGVESMSFTSMSTIKAPTVDWDAMQQSRAAMDCLLPMGITSESVCKEYGLQRHVLDDFAVESHRRAAAAQAAGKFAAEICPVGSVRADDGIRAGTTRQLLTKLNPAFAVNGLTTAGNSSQTTDGAAAVLLMRRSEARRRGLPVWGVWRGFSTVGVPPRIMGIGPAVAIPKVLEQVGISKDEVDVYEINEAFASQATWCVDELGLDYAKVNPNGGAIALGHPLGCTGARMVATLVHELHRRKGRYGVISMCIGTGMGAAAVIEVEPSSSL